MSPTDEDRPNQSGNDSHSVTQELHGPRANNGVADNSEIMEMIQSLRADMQSGLDELRASVVSIASQGHGSQTSPSATSVAPTQAPTPGPLQAATRLPNPPTNVFGTSWSTNRTWRNSWSAGQMPRFVPRSLSSGGAVHRSTPDRIPDMVGDTVSRPVTPSQPSSPDSTSMGTEELRSAGDVGHGQARNAHGQAEGNERAMAHRMIWYQGHSKRDPLADPMRGT